MRLLCLPILLTFLAMPAWSANCRLALVLALDVSGSVNETEYRQQLDGLATALASPAVRAAILDQSAGHVDLSVFEWSSRNHQFLIQPWISLRDTATIDEVTARIRAYRKQRAGLKTALSTALIFASELLSGREDCSEHKIDVSGDGKNNVGASVADIYASPRFDRITVNALVVGDPASAQAQDASGGLTRLDLQSYFEAQVIRGPGAFSMIAYGYQDYARAMQRKLLREIMLPVIGQARP